METCFHLCEIERTTHPETIINLLYQSLWWSLDMWFSPKIMEKRCSVLTQHTIWLYCHMFSTIQLQRLFEKVEKWWSAASDNLASVVAWPKLNRNRFGMCWIEEGGKSCQQVLRIHGTSFKTVEKAFQVTVSWSWLRKYMCKAVEQIKRSISKKWKCNIVLTCL